MNRIVRLALLIVIAVAGGLWFKLLPAFEYRWAVDHARIRANPRADLYHKFVDQPCRTGYLLVRRAFGRREETWDGCWNGYAPSFSIDFLLDDEDVALGAVVRTQ